MTSQWALQAGYDVRFDWGSAGARALGSVCPTVVVVDVLRFTTALDVAVSAGVAVVPARWAPDEAERLACSLGAVLADGAGGRPSLSPTSFSPLAAGSVVVLPSPNGATCALEAAHGGATVVGACLRNAAAVAAWLVEAVRPVGVVACGERWPGGALRPSLEDLFGAAAVLSGLAGTCSPEAAAAALLWPGVAHQNLEQWLLATSSGRELTEWGRSTDVVVAAAVGVSQAVPVLEGDRFVDRRR